MNPSEIKHASEAAIFLNKTFNRGTPSAFILSWIAWEGLKYRILVIGFVRMGWQVADVKEVLATSEIHTYVKYKRLFKAIYGNYPERVKGVAKIWQEAESFRKIRNNYVHGSRGSDPKTLLRASQFLINAVVDVHWLRFLMINDEEAKLPIGNPYSRQITQRKTKRSKSQLKQFIDSALEKGK